MADTFKVWLVGYAKSRNFQYDCYGSEPMAAIASNLKSLFDSVCEKTSAFSGSEVTWNNGVPGETDVVVYVFYSKNDSIISSKEGNPVHDSASGGTFQSSDGMISEVFLEPMDGAANFAKVVSNLIFHEIMHNKLDAPTVKTIADIHVSGGGGLANATISASSALTDDNKKHMAAGMAKKIRQFTAKMKDPSS
ncbi:MAG: hypothetical protein R2684_07890 [Pyrinomonadaceae bacterium]